jgi:hypothetical protein
MLSHLGLRTNTTGKPPGLPENWPNSTQEELACLPKRIVKVGTEQDYFFQDNFVKTSKYELYNFLPRFTLEEFNPKQKMANLYFLIVAGLQCIKVISNTGGLPTTLIPLTFVVIVDGIFAVLEDLARHRADRAANASITRRFNKEKGLFEECSWHEGTLPYVYLLDIRMYTYMHTHLSAWVHLCIWSSDGRGLRASANA